MLLLEAAQLCIRDIQTLEDIRQRWNLEKADTTRRKNRVASLVGKGSLRPLTYSEQL